MKKAKKKSKIDIKLEQELVLKERQDHVLGIMACTVICLAFLICFSSGIRLKNRGEIHNSPIATKQYLVSTSPTKDEIIKISEQVYHEPVLVEEKVEIEESLKEEIIISEPQLFTEVQGIPVVGKENTEFVIIYKTETDEYFVLGPEGYFRADETFVARNFGEKSMSDGVVLYTYKDRQYKLYENGSIVRVK